MKKRFVCMFLALAMLFALAACGNSSTPAASDNSSASDGSSDTIKLGGIGALTGGYANYGLSVQHGAQLAVDEINAAGGVNGKQLELNFQDSQGDPESAVSAYGKLMDWGMDVKPRPSSQPPRKTTSCFSLPPAPPTPASAATTRPSASASMIPTRAPQPPTT